MEYAVIEAATLDELVRKVAEWMVQDWKPQGGVATDRSGYFYQAMIRER